jgi:hypothetical protein
MLGWAFVWFVWGQLLLWFTPFYSGLVLLDLIDPQLHDSPNQGLGCRARCNGKV